MFFVYISRAKFQKANFNSNWGVKKWDQMFWINTFTSLSTFLCYDYLPPILKTAGGIVLGSVAVSGRLRHLCGCFALYLGCY